MQQGQQANRKLLIRALKLCDATYLSSTLLLLGVKCKQVGNLLLQSLAFSLEPTDFLCHQQNLSGKFFLKFLDVDYHSVSLEAEEKRSSRSGSREVAGDRVRP